MIVENLETTIAFFSDPLILCYFVGSVNLKIQISDKKQIGIWLYNVNWRLFFRRESEAYVQQIIAKNDINNKNEKLEKLKIAQEK